MQRYLKTVHGKRSQSLSLRNSCLHLPAGFYIEKENGSLLPADERNHKNEIVYDVREVNKQKIAGKHF